MACQKGWPWPNSWRAQQRQGDAVFAAERDEVGERRGLRLNAIQAPGYVAEGDGEIADVAER